MNRKVNNCYDLWMFGVNFFLVKQSILRSCHLVYIQNSGKYLNLIANCNSTFNCSIQLNDSAKLHPPHLRWLFHLMVTSLHTVWERRVPSRQGVWSLEPVLWLSSCCCERKAPTANRLTMPRNRREPCSGPVSTWNQNSGIHYQCQVN